MYTIIGGNPFVDFSGTECAGLILVLFNGEEVEYENGKYKRPLEG